MKNQKSYFVFAARSTQPVLIDQNPSSPQGRKTFQSLRMASCSGMGSGGGPTEDLVTSRTKREKSKLSQEKQLRKCSGCQWQGKSLRGHLRAKPNCQKFFDMDALEEEAKKVQKQQRSEWESANRKKRTKRMKKVPVKTRQVLEAPETILKACKGCQWTGKSLRGHLRGNSGCHTFYDMDQLEKDAKKIKKLQEAEWETRNRKKRTERKKGKVTGSPKPGSHICNICDRAFTFKYMLNRHIKDIHKIKIHVCYGCPKSFARRENFKRHLVKCSQKPGAKSVVEGPETIVKWYRAKMERAAITQTKSNTAPSIPKKELKICKVCQWHGKSLRGHLRQRSQCKKIYDVEELEREAKDIKKQREAAWELANRKKRSERMGKKDKTGSANPGTHTCNICDRVFNFKNNLHRHINDVHNESKQYKCPKCPEHFSRQENLRRHLEREKHSFVFYCYICKKKFTFKNEREKKRHFVKHKKGELPRKENNENPSSTHPVVNSKNEPTPSASHQDTGHEIETIIHECQHCDEKFREKFNLKRHVDDVHKKLRRYRCDKCAEEFSRLHNLKRHKEMVDHRLPFRCPSCRQEEFFLTKREAERYFSRCSTRKEDMERREKRRHEIKTDMQKLEELKKSGRLWHQLTEDQKKELEEEWKPEKLLDNNHITEVKWNYEEAFETIRMYVVSNQRTEQLEFKKSEEWKTMPEEMKEEFEDLWKHARGPRRAGTVGSYENCCYDCIEGYPWWKEVLETRRKERNRVTSSKKN